jgi:hypothetical protein
MSDYSDVEHLRDLAERLMSIPVMYGTDQGDTDRLLESARRIETLEAALRKIIGDDTDNSWAVVVARTALTPEQDKPEPDKNYWAGTGRAGNGNDI